MTEVCSTQDTLVVCIADSNSVLFSNLAPALHSFGLGDLGAVRITSGLLGSLGFDAEHGTVLEIAVTVWSTVFAILSEFEWSECPPTVLSQHVGARSPRAPARRLFQ
jgi:hypothetical protein